MCSDDEPGLEVACDRMLGDERSHKTLARFGDGPEVAGMLSAEPGFEHSLGLTVTRMDLAAVSAGCCKANALGFEQNRANARLCEMQSGRQARVAATDD